jgi:hypothetical protein
MSRNAKLASSRTGRSGRIIAAVLPAMIALAAAADAATLTVTSASDSGAGSLRDTIAAASAGDKIVFDARLTGRTITLTSGEIAIAKSLDIEGPGPSLLALSGNDASRIFNVGSVSCGTIVTDTIQVTIAGLTLTHGRARAPVGGGAVLSANSTTILHNDVFSFNMNGWDAEPPAGFCTCELFNAGGFRPAVGGAVSSIGLSPANDCYKGSIATLIVSDCSFLHNLVKGPPAEFGAEGGAICNHAGVATVTGCLFFENQSLSGDGGDATFAMGGAIVTRSPPTGSSSLTVADCTFVGNLVRGGDGGTDGAGGAYGGALINHDTSTLTLSRSLFLDNQAIGGSNNAGPASGFDEVGIGDGGAIENDGVATITDCVFDHNRARGGEGNRGGGGDVLVGHGTGGAIFNISVGDAGYPGILTLSNVAFIDNEALGGANSTGGGALSGIAGDALGGAIANRAGATVTASDTSFSGNRAIGGTRAPGGPAADGVGGAIASYLGSAATLSHCTLLRDQAMGGAPGGNGLGGGIFNEGISLWGATLGTPSMLGLCGSSITLNLAIAGARGGSADGGGVFLTSGGVACSDATVIAGNAPDDISGTWSAGCSPCP